VALVSVLDVVVAATVAVLLVDVVVAEDDEADVEDEAPEDVAVASRAEKATEAVLLGLATTRITSVSVVQKKDAHNELHKTSPCSLVFI
jgi:hypothetical protein